MKLNFTFILKVDDVLVTGQELASGYWSGMIGKFSINASTVFCARKKFFKIFTEGLNIKIYAYL